MDSNILLAGFLGIIGALSGAIVGAWLNPLMQDLREKRNLRKFITNCTQAEKFVILNAYRNVFLPIANVKIIDSNKFNIEDMAILNNLVAFCECLDSTIQKFREERKIFATFRENKYRSGYTISLYSNMTDIINSDKNIQDNLLKETKAFIANEIYPHYCQFILSKSIFYKIDKMIIRRYMVFMHHIGVFDIYNKDLSHLNLKNPKSYLELPKGIFYPEFN